MLSATDESAARILIAEVAIEAPDRCDEGPKRLDGFDGEVEDDEL